MKRLILCLIAVALLIIGAGANAEEAAMQIVNCDEWVSLRAEPSTTAARLAKIPLGSSVTDCALAENGYVACRYNDAVGYVQAQYLSGGLPLDLEMRVANCDEWVSLRQSPDTNSVRLAEVPLHGLVTAHELANDGFVRCSYGNQDGYLLAAYLVPAGNSADAPEAEALPTWTNETISSNLMVIVNCEDWVSLRSAPDKSAQRIAKVPIGAFVTDCSAASGGFIRCNYLDSEGYILADYLRGVDASGDALLTYDEVTNFGQNILYERIGDYTVIASLRYSDIETLQLSCFDINMHPVWSHITSSPYVAQVTLLDAFTGGTMDRPLVFVHNPCLVSAAEDVDYPVLQALTAFDLATGEIAWSLSAEETGLSGGLVTAFDDNGNLYAGGYFGPDPLCISPEGEILWRGRCAQDDVFWLAKLIPTNVGVYAQYESGPDGEMSMDSYYECYFQIDLDPFEPDLKPKIADGWVYPSVIAAKNEN